MTQQQRMQAMMRVYFDALDCVPSPTGELIYLDGRTRMFLAWHLARAVGEDAVIKRQPVPARPGGIAGAVQWVPIDTPDTMPDVTSAVGEIPDPATIVDSMPWHVRTKIEGFA